MYNHFEIEKKWQTYWEKNKTFKTENSTDKPKYYCLDMFPYPSGAGLHVGHPKGFVANDVYARYKKTKGFNVLHPMGWDAFGLPAENYAIKTGTHPRIKTDENIANYKRQLKDLGFSYDWDREIDTTDPKYYKWTQWIFLKMFENGLAYEQDLPINYCPSCKTGLANEEVLNNGTCERCNEVVEKKKIRQWVLAITKYADRLLNDVDKLDWPEGIKQMQRNWIGKSEGCEFEMVVVENDQQKNENCSSEGSCHDGKAKFSLYNSIFENITKVKKKNKRTPLYKIYKEIKNNKGIIIFNGKNLNKHFSQKDHKDIRIRKQFSETIIYGLGNIKIESENIGFIAYKSIVFKVILGKQNNGKYFVKTYYVSDKYTKEYKNYLEDISVIGKISVYTTRIDTVFSMAFAVIAPDHADTLKFITKKQEKEALEYIGKSKNISDQDRTEKKEKTGVFSGSYVINPYNNEKVPLWIGDFVLGNYGTGAVFGDAHDERDFVFAKKYGIDLKISIVPEKDSKIKKEEVLNFEKPFTDYGILINSGEFDGLKSKEAKTILSDYAEKNLFGHKKVNYKLRDWLFSRQRYWGEPIPLIHLKNNDIDKLEKVDDKKMRVAIPHKEGVARNGNSAKLSSTIIILENITKVKRKRKKHSFDNIVINEKTEKGEILFNGKKLRRHFYSKDIRERRFRKSYGITISKYLKDVFYESELVGYISINERIFRVVLEKIGNKKYEVKTYYLSTNYTKTFNKAYIKEKDDGEYLYIKAKEFSKIHYGLYERIVCDYNLPLELPEVKNYAPSGDGQSPLANVDDFVNITLADNLEGKRETNTMPQWGGSCWYYLRYMDPENSEKLVDPEIEKYWGSVDSYVGGAEHAVLHLLYARFWHKFLFDIGVVSNDEPFTRLRNQGMIQAYAYETQNGKIIHCDDVEEKNNKYYHKETGEELNQIVAKMSKSLGNVVNPDEIIKEYGTDTLRLYEMYMSDFKDSAPWDTKNIIGVRRFLEKSERLYTSEIKIAKDDNETIKLLHKTIKKVTNDIENYKFNTAIASLMILVNNGIPKDEKLQKEWKSIFPRLLHPFAPHLAEELWEKSNNPSQPSFNTKGRSNNGHKSIFLSNWPEYDENMVKDDIVTVGVQILGKVRGELTFSKNEDKEIVLKKAKEIESVKKWLEGKSIIKEIYIPGKVINFVVK